MRIDENDKQGEKVRKTAQGAPPSPKSRKGEGFGQKRLEGAQATGQAPPGAGSGGPLAEYPGNPGAKTGAP